MEMLSGIHQADQYAVQNIVPRNMGAASSLPRLEELLTGIPTIDEVIRAEYDKLASQKEEQMAAVNQAQPTEQPQANQVDQDPVPGQGSSIMKNSSAFPANTGWWSA